MILRSVHFCARIKAGLFRKQLNRFLAVREPLVQGLRLGTGALHVLFQLYDRCVWLLFDLISESGALR